MKVSLHKTVDLNEEITSENKTLMLEILTIFNNIMKEALGQLDYKQIGKFPTFFNVKDKIDVREYNLQAWPGYQVETKLTTKGIFLNIESRTKFINKTSILDMFLDHSYSGKRNEEFYGKYDSSNIEMKRKTVLTEHNSRAYQVDGMDTRSPYEIKMNLPDGKEISIAQYFHDRYKIDLDKK
jgi:aubergine-like protein